MLVLAYALGGRSRTDAAEICGTNRQPLRSNACIRRIHRYNGGLAGLIDRPLPAERRCAARSRCANWQRSWRRARTRRRGDPHEIVAERHAPDAMVCGAARRRSMPSPTTWRRLHRKDRLGAAAVEKPAHISLMLERSGKGTPEPERVLLHVMTWRAVSLVGTVASLATLGKLLAPEAFAPAAMAAGVIHLRARGALQPAAVRHQTNEDAAPDNRRRREPVARHDDTPPSLRRGSRRIRWSARARCRPQLKLALLKSRPYGNSAGAAA